jgi:hypothetical protein
MGLRKHEGNGCILADEMYVTCTTSIGSFSLLDFVSEGSRENTSGSSSIISSVLFLF